MPLATTLAPVQPAQPSLSTVVTPLTSTTSSVPLSGSRMSTRQRKHISTYSSSPSESEAIDDAEMALIETVLETGDPALKKRSVSDR